VIVKKKNEQTSQNHSETKKINDFISRGGTLPVKKKIDEEVRFTLRLPKQLIHKIDKKRKKKLGRVSRNQIIIEILHNSTELKLK